MRDRIEKAALRHGFDAVYFLSSLPLSAWREAASRSGVGRGMDWDVPRAFPKAKCVVLLAGAYSPFAEEKRIPAYYLRENRGYFEARALSKEIASQGFYCEAAWLPVRALALANGVGAPCRNGLLALPGFGTRTALFALATDACDPLPSASDTPGCPDACDACARACPTGAISKGGLDVKKCIRSHMNGAAHPSFVLEKLSSYLGCDICQRVCPKNAGLKTAEPTGGMRAAFDLRRLILGDTKDARALVGRNVTGGGKLTVEAIAFAARDGLYQEEIRAALSSPHPAVRDAAEWALERYP